MSGNEVGTFLTKKGNKCVVTRTQVLWYNTDGSVDQIFVRDIRSVKVSSTGLFSTTYIVDIYLVADPAPERTFFTTKNEQEGMLNAVQTAMRYYGSN